MDDLKYWVWLSSLPGIGARRFNQLIEYFGSPYEVWNANYNQLFRVQGLGKNIYTVLNQKYRDNLEFYMHRIKEIGIDVLRAVDDDYPVHLKAIYDPPPVLYVRGKLEKSDDRAVAIIGSRKATIYGLNMAKEIAFELAIRGITVVSGMARGVDTFAHRGALEAGGRTIAVLGCGVDIPYPPENKMIIDQVSKSGSVISEFAVGMKPLSGNFPARNRIISGLSMGVVVIEAGDRSGSLITVDFALEQGKEVFAAPGNATSYESKGTNRLIKEGAKMVTCVEDVLEEFAELRTIKVVSEKKNEQQYSNLDEDERKIINNIGAEPVHIDILLRRTGHNIQKINSVLTMLELKGILKQLPGKFFLRA